MHTNELAVIEARPLGYPRKTIDRRIVRRMIEVTVAAALNLPVDELAAKTRRTAPIAFARQISMYCAHVTFGWSLTEAGAVFSRDRTTAAHACRVVEDRRDCPRIDAVVTAVEEQLMGWLTAMEYCRQTVEGALE
ncbi:helix-turn-helix domain-containing protein [Acuticoccus yangtzensis]|uniref:helix-turn-helix domain-containing protein n=1 Tax=Acuticoccus yangtzensis TaxID=1443441 RepID=UPI0009F8B8BE|nr:helix-turn-helix domain-containing protein [Acuticoccus yangtzensis]